LKAFCQWLCLVLAVRLLAVPAAGMLLLQVVLTASVHQLSAGLAALAVAVRPLLLLLMLFGLLRVDVSWLL
jgi:hypothetical protein